MTRSPQLALRSVGADATRGTARVPPNDLQAEESLLGAMLLSRDAIAAAVECCSFAMRRAWLDIWLPFGFGRLWRISHDALGHGGDCDSPHTEAQCVKGLVCTYRSTSPCRS